MTDEKTEKLPIDAKLLTDVVIELNISRRSVSLYPREHPITRESLERAYDFLIKLFAIRNSVTLGVARDVLMIDDFVLDKRNPVFREFALSIHKMGMAAVTFTSGLTIDELAGLHELLVSGDAVIGQERLKVAEEKGLRHIRLIPIDMSKLGFAEGGEHLGGSGIDLWGNYITGLIEGRLTGEDAEGVVLNIAPEDVAEFLNSGEASKQNDSTYDRVITTYMKRKGHTGIKSELFAKFIALVDNLSPKIKQQLLKRTFNSPVVDNADIEHLMAGLSLYDLEKLMTIFNENSSLIPESLRNVLDKLGSIQTGGSFFDLLSGGQALVDDIEIDDHILKLFKGDNFRAFVSDDYKEDLARMLKGPRKKHLIAPEEISMECRPAVVDWKLSELDLELLESEVSSRDDYLVLLTRLTELVNDFLETGRYFEISEICNTIYTHTLTGRFRDEALSMMDYFFHSEAFISSFIESLRVWGRHNREGVLRLVNVQRRHLVEPLFSALLSSEDPSLRKFILQVLGSLGSDVTGPAAVRLGDERWYVVRNMIYLIREAGGVSHMRQVRQFTRNTNRKISLEAVRTLVHFKAPDALSHMKIYLTADDSEMREQMVKFAGIYRMKSAVPILGDLLEKRSLIERDFEFKRLLIRTLGEIGDEGALRAFEAIIRTQPFIRRSAFESLKVEVFRSLANFPQRSLTKILEWGRGSGNQEIRTISERMLGGDPQ